MSPKLYVADLLSAEPAEPSAAPVAPPQTAPKKERSAKQIAAWEKAKATREAKAAAAAALVDEAARKAEADAKVLRDRLEALEAKKEARREKRLAAKTHALGHVTPSESSATEPPPPEPKRVRRAAVHDPNEPPKWFKEYVHSVKAEKAQIANEPVPKRQLKRESAEHASELWREPQTRDRVNAEANDQMARMYSTIFSGRRLY